MTKECTGGTATTAVRFEVRYGPAGTDRDTWQHYSSHDTGKEAADKLAQAKANDQSGSAWAVVRVSYDPEGDSNWRERETARFASGRYRPVPWAIGPEGEADDIWTKHYPDHFVHIAESDARKIAYTDSELKGRQDRQTVLSVSEYLNRFYGRGDCVCGCQPCMLPGVRDYYVEMVSGASRSIQWAATADEIQDIYERSGGTDRSESSCGSCMGYETDHFDSHMHPVRVYAAGDLQVAYLTNDEGKPLARTLAWPERKVFGRVYGDQALSLRNALKALGYSSPNGHHSLDGARLLKVCDTGNPDCYVLPYIDGSGRVSDCGDHFTIGGNIQADDTGGLTRIQLCDKCGDGLDSDDSGREVNGETWCESCVNRYAFYCNECCEYSLDDDGRETVHVPRRLSRGSYEYTWCQSCVDADATFIPSRDEYWHNASVSPCDTCEQPEIASDLSSDSEGEGSYCSSCCVGRNAEIEAEATTETQEQENAA